VDLKVRNEKVFGNADKQKMLLLEDLWPYVMRREMKVKAISHWERITLLGKVSWRQKHRALWLREGNKYTVFP
jgi:hypothetical protein